MVRVVDDVADVAGVADVVDVVDDDSDDGGLFDLHRQQQPTEQHGYDDDGLNYLTLDFVPFFAILLAYS